MGLFKRNGSWVIDFYNGSRRIREKVGSKGEAEKALSVRKAEIAQGRFAFRAARSFPTFEEFAERYKEFAQISKRGFPNERYRIAQLVKFFGKRRISEISNWDAEKLKGDLSKSLAPATVNRLLGNARHMFSMAMKWDELPKNPFAGVKLLRVPDMKDRILTVDEESKFLKACDKVRAPYLKSLIILAVNTGMRRGEILGLTWSQIDLEQRTIHVQNSKTKSSNRLIPMNETIFDLLAALEKNRQGDLVFPSCRKDGHPLRDPKVAFRKAIRLCGIPHIRFHDLRHTFATRLVRSGVDLITVQQLLGHAKITMTARYAHSLPDDKIAAVRRLDFARVC
jgi:integrase